MILLDEYRAITFQYQDMLELIECKNKMIHDGWQIEQLDDEQLIVSYFKYFK